MSYQKPSLTDKILYRILTRKKLKTPQSKLIEKVHPVVLWGKSKYDPKKHHLKTSKDYRIYKRKNK